jgi:WD40 repeat protein
MNLKLLLGLALILGGGLFATTQAQSADAKDTTRIRLEQMAEAYGHFSQTVVIYGRPLQLWPPLEQGKTATNGFSIPKRGTNVLAAEQLRLVKELRELSGNREALAALLKHANPKVRTLALGAIFQRNDGRDLPLIAGLINDSAPTFPNLHDPMSSMAGPRPLPELENPQSVGTVAQTMLAFWGVSHDGRSVEMGFGRLATSITTDDFAGYWKKYADRKYAASWFMVKMKHATRQTTPIQPEYRLDIQSVITEMKSLPMPDRAWIQLYVLAPGGWVEFEKEDLVATDGELIAVAKKLGPAALLRFLQRQKVSDDPDLLLDKDNPEFVRISNFILRHADQLLRPEDCDALLACQYVMHDSGGVNPAWGIGAALVQPARAGEILHNALAHETRSYETAAGELAGALWRIRGLAELDFLVNWFYTVLPTASEPMHQPVAFLWGVETAARPDTKQLMAALVKDSRFDHTDWATLVEMLKIANTDRATPLVANRDIYDAQPNGLADVRRIYPEWRNRLRREYGLPEEPLPAALAVPEQVLTQPAWSVPMPQQEDLAGQWQLVPSPDGQWLALLSHEIVTLWQADTGKLAWQPPSFQARADGYPTVAGDVAFTAGGQLLIFDHGDYGRFRVWDLATHQETSKVRLSGKPTSGVDDGRYSFDRTAQRMAFAGYNNLGCFDTRTGAALWMHPREGGVKIPAALSADGSHLAVGGGTDYPQVVRLYDALTGERRRQFDSLAGQVLALAISANGQRLVTATAADGLQLWDAGSGKLLQTFAWQVPGWNMGAPVFSADGRWLAAVGSSSAIGAHEIGIFNTDTGRLKWVIRFQTDSSFGADLPLSFSPDGKHLYTAAGMLEAWRLCGAE